MKKSLVLIIAVLIVTTGITCRETGDDLTDRAHQAYKAKNYEKAKALCSKALAKDPNNVMAHVLRGWLYKDEGKLDETILEYNKAIAINPREKAVRIYRGDAYFVKGMFDEAISEFETALTIDPEYPAAHYHLGLTYRSKGNNTLAGKYFYEAGVLALLRDEKGIILKAYRNLKETGPRELEQDFQEIIAPWLGPDSKKGDSQSIEKDAGDH